MGRQHHTALLPKKKASLNMGVSGHQRGNWVRSHRIPDDLFYLSQLRKPVVEKMRRDRINSSIEQLKLLLEKEFQRHQPNSKLEKADILEMTVSYLKQQSQLQMKSKY